MAGGYPGGGKSNAVLERPQTSFRVGKAQKASSSSQLFCFFLSSQSRTDLVIAPLSGRRGVRGPGRSQPQKREQTVPDPTTASRAHSNVAALHRVMIVDKPLLTWRATFQQGLVQRKPAEQLETPAPARLPAHKVSLDGRLRVPLRPARPRALVGPSRVFRSQVQREMGTIVKEVA